MAENKATTTQLEEVNSRLAKGEGWIGYRAVAPNHLYYAFYVNGKQKFVNSKTNDVEDAYRQLLDARGVVKRGMTVLPSEVGRLRYEDLRDAYTQDNTIRVDRLKTLDNFFRRMKVTDITTAALRKYIWKRREQVADPTIRRELIPLRAMFKLAVREKTISHDNVPWFPMPEDSLPAGQYITPEQFAKVLSFLPNGKERGSSRGGPKSTTNLRPFFTFLYATGCRLGAAQKITWEDVAPDCSTVKIDASDTKNKQPLTLPLAGPVLEPIAKELHKRFHDDNQPVFDSTNHRPEWAKACAKAGLGAWNATTRTRTNEQGERKGVRIHDCRASGAINLLAAGVDEGLVLKIGGWKTRKMLDRYNIADLTRLTEAMRKGGKFVKERMQAAK